MTIKEAYREYRSYYYNNQWTWEDIKCYLKENWIDYEEYNFEEFKDKVLTDDKFNNKWGNGCTKQLTGEEMWELLRKKVGDEVFNTWVEEIVPFGGGLSEYLQEYKIPKREIIN